MSSEAVYSKLTAIMRDVFDDDTIVAAPQVTADDVLGWDSFANIRLFQALERAFAVEFTADEMLGLRNIGEVAAAIEAKTHHG